MTPLAHLESIEPGLSVDMLERAAIRADSGQKYEAALHDAYLETCKRVGVKPLRDEEP